jgi:hypothetical protein
MQIQEAKEVVKVAADFLSEQEPAAKESRLERIEERSDGEWSVVLSFPGPGMLSPVFRVNPESATIYKELSVNSRAQKR